MSTQQVVVLVAVFLTIDLFIVAAVVRSAADATFGVLSRRYPAAPTTPPSVRRNFASMKSDWINLGYCVHIEADAVHLHLYPAMILRWAGARTASIPWNRIQIGRARFFGGYREATIDTLNVLLPAWCLPEPKVPDPATDNPDESDAAAHR
jgi:hypothetical protein